MYLKVRKGAVAALAVLLALCAVLAVLISAAFADKTFAYGRRDMPAGAIAAVAAKGKLADESFLALNSLSIGSVTVRADGGGSIADAFDKNTASIWRSDIGNSEGFSNRVTVSSPAPVTVSCIIYGGAFTVVDGENLYYGFPRHLKVYRADGTGSPELVASFSGEAEAPLTAFMFERPVAFGTMILEFAEIAPSPFSDGGKAAASEIYLVNSFGEEEEKITEEVKSVFTDYARFLPDRKYDLEKLSALRVRASGCVNYETALKPVLDRAEAVLEGKLKKDARREFSTEAAAANKIVRGGNVREYACDTLLVDGIGTDRQTLGIGAAYGETLTVYVETENGLPLPSLAFASESGDGVGFTVRPLSRGVNAVTFPLPSTATPRSPGGQIYIVYTCPQDTRGDVKVYVEGGYNYPVYRKGGNENEFYSILKDYVSKLSGLNASAYSDVFEAVADNVTVTGSSKLLLNYLSSAAGAGIAENLGTLDSFIRSMFGFGGITFDEKAEAYDQRNPFIRVDFRFDEAYAGVYDAVRADFIYIDENDFDCIFGSGSPSEQTMRSLGRALDRRGSEWSGYTDGMYAAYGQWLLTGEYAADIAGAAEKLASDSGRYAIDKNLWLNGGDAAWWLLFGADPDYWADLQNAYATEATGKSLDPTERFIYYSSLALGQDAGAYFERWGYYHGGSKYGPDNRFSCDRASPEYKELTAAAKSGGRIAAVDKKYYYIDERQFELLKENDYALDKDWAGKYDSNATVSVTQIVRASVGYTLFMPEVEEDAHLCYEVQCFMEGGWKVLGITYGIAFTDTNRYAEGVRPKYRVYAYDRLLNRTGVPRETEPVGGVQAEVCRIGNVKYNSLREAVAVARENDTVYLLKSFSDCGIVIDKNLTVLPDPSAGDGITLSRSGTGALITVQSSFNMGGAGAKIILDGKGFYQSGALIETRFSGAPQNIKFTNVTFKNNFNDGDGGGLCLSYGARQVELYGCVIENNRALNGGGLCLVNDRDGNYYPRVNMYGVTVSGNTARLYGGGVYCSGTGGLTAVYCSPADGYSSCAVIGNKAKDGGGIYSEATVNMKAAVFTGNTASGKGGGAYVAAGSIIRRFELADCTVADNIAGEASSTAIYLAGGYSTLGGGKFSGGIYKANGSTLNLNGSMPDFKDAEFVLPEIASSGTTLVDTVTGFSLTADAATGLNIAYGVAAVNGAKIIVLRKIANITLDFGNGSVVVQTECGKYVLPERADGLDENVYIGKWSADGKDYFAGDTVIIDGNCSFEVELTPYIAVTLANGAHVKEYKVVKYDEFCLPSETPDGKPVYGWFCSDGKYYACGEQKEIEYDTAFTADTKPAYRVALEARGLTRTEFFAYGDSFTLPVPEAAFGKVFSHWLSDGVIYAAGQTLIVKSDFSAVAVYSAQRTVKFISVDGERSGQYEEGEEIPLSVPSKHAGGEFICWLSGGVRYYAGGTYVVRGNAEITAVYGAAREKVKITLISSGADGQTVTVSEYGFGDKIKLGVPSETEDGVFACWRINGAAYSADCEISATDDFTAIAEYAAADAEDDVVVAVIVQTSDGEDLKFYRYAYASSVLLGVPEYSPSGRIFSHWAINGERFEAGESFTVKENCAIVAVYDDAHKIELNYISGGEDKVDVFEYGNSRLFRLPAPESPQGKIFTHWALGDIKLAAGEEIPVVADMSLKAVYRELSEFTVTFSGELNGEIKDTQKKFTEGDKFVLPEADDKLFGDKFHYWDVNGVRYASGATVTVLEDLLVKAVYSAQYKVTVVQLVDGKERAQDFTVSHGDTFKLPEPAPTAEDRIFTCWEVNGKKLRPGDRITVTADTVITARYVDKDGEPVIVKDNRKLWITLGVAGGVAAAAAIAGATVYLVRRKKKADADKK